MKNLTVSPEEAGFLAEIAYLWHLSDDARGAYSDWLLDRSRPEWYVVRHYKPREWLRETIQDGGVRYTIPWLKNGKFYKAFDRESSFPPQIMLGLLAANGIKPREPARG